MCENKSDRTKCALARSGGADRRTDRPLQVGAVQAPGASRGVLALLLQAALRPSLGRLEGQIDCSHGALQALFLDKALISVSE